MELTKQVAMFLHSRKIANYDASGISGNTFIQLSPDFPDDSISIYSKGGPEGDRKNEYRRSAIQILIRAKDPRTGEAKAQSVVDALNGFNSDRLQPLGHYIIDTSATQGAPNGLGTDQKGRYEFSQNFLIEYEIGGN